MVRWRFRYRNGDKSNWSRSYKNRLFAMEKIEPIFGTSGLFQDVKFIEFQDAVYDSQNRPFFINEN